MTKLVHRAAAIVLLTAIPTLGLAQDGGMRAQGQAMRAACKADYEKLCANVAPGGGRIIACLKSYADQVSAPCAQILSKAQSLRDRAAAPK